MRQATQRERLQPDPADADEPLRPQRVLFVGKRKSRTRCTGALLDALRSHGLDVSYINCSFLRRWIGRKGMRAVFRRLQRQLQPDLCVVFFHDLPPDLMRDISTAIPTIVWMEEQPSITEQSHIDYVRDVRLLCLSTPQLVGEYRAQGIDRATFLMSGFSPRFHKPVGRSKQVRDLAFIGGPGGKGDRAAFLSWLGEHHDVDIFGLRELWHPYLAQYPGLRLRSELRPRGYARVCASSRIVLGKNQSTDSPLYFSNRTFLTLACRGFHLTRYVPLMETVFERGVHLDWFETRAECLEKIDWYLRHPEARARIAQNGYELVTERHKYADRIGEILEILRDGSSISNGEAALTPTRPDLFQPLWIDPRLRALGQGRRESIATSNGRNGASIGQNGAARMKKLANDR